MKSNQIASVCRQSAVYTVPDKLPDHLCGSRHLLKINGQPCFIYQTEVTCGAHYQIGFAEYASFDLYGKAEVQIDAQYPIDCVEVLPSRTGIVAEQDGQQITFTIDKPGQYFVKVNGNDKNGNTAEFPLYLFANSPETNIPQQDDPDIVYFSPGIYSHQNYELESGKTYYLAPGAFVYGRFFGKNIHDVTICGRGILCGEVLTDLYDEGRTICIRNSENITIEGICIVHPKVWTVAVYNSKQVHIHNIKTISHGMSSDGCDICGCQEVLVENCFFRGHDDILAVKASEMIYGVPFSELPIDCISVTFRNCVVWCDSSNPMTIGYETAGNIRDILFEHIDVLNQSMPPVWRLEAIMAIEPHDKGNVEKVIFRDIRVDLALPDYPLKSLFRFAVDRGTGTIKDVLVENVWIAGGSPGGCIWGLDTALPIENIRFRNVRSKVGKILRQKDILCNDQVGTIVIEPSDKADDSEQMEKAYCFEWDFLDIQGFHNWYYQYKNIQTGEIGNMIKEDAQWRCPDSDFCIIQQGFLHCDGAYDPILTWRAPKKGKVEVSGQATRRCNGGDGTRLYVLRNEHEQLWNRDLPNDPNAVYSICFQVIVDAGDTLNFGTNQIGNPDCDGVDWAPVIRYI